MERLGDDRSSQAGEKVRAESMGVAYPVRDAEEVAIVFRCEARSDERARLRPSLDDEHGLREADHNAISRREVMGMSEIVPRVFGEECAAGVENISSKSQIGLRRNHLIAEP